MIKLKSSSSTNTVENVLKKSVISAGFEQLHSVPSNHKSERLLRKQRRVSFIAHFLLIPTHKPLNLSLVSQKERAKTKGSDWYNLPATKKTEEVMKDLEVLQMRSALDPKRFYKNNDMKTLPKYFQVSRQVLILFFIKIRLHTDFTSIYRSVA